MHRHKTTYTLCVIVYVVSEQEKEKNECKEERERERERAYLKPKVLNMYIKSLSLSPSLHISLSSQALTHKNNVVYVVMNVYSLSLMGQIWS